MPSAVPLIWVEAGEISPHTHHRVLLLSHHYPPSIDPGARRTDGFLLWLPKYGWEPTLITGGWNSGKRNVLEVPHEGLMHRLRAKMKPGKPKPEAAASSFAGIGQAMADWYDAHMGWTSKVMREAIGRYQKRRIDLVCATGAPIALAYAAQQISTVLRCPYVVDLQHPLPDYLADASPRHWLMKAIGEATAVTVASPACVTSTLTRARKMNPPVCVLGGIWHREMVAARPTEQFTLLHAGTLHRQARNPEALFEALATLATEIPEFRKETRVRFIGPDSQYATLAPAYTNVADFCELEDTMPFRDAQQAMQEASVLLILNSERERYAEPITGKFFDYLPFEAPILAIGGTPGLPVELLAWTGAGGWAGSVEEITEAIRAHYLAWKTASVVRAPRDMDALAFLSQRRMAGELGELFNAIGEHRDLVLQGVHPWSGADANRQFTDGLSYKPMSLEDG
ncbi:MAG: hypothetical protein BWY76_01314 [bacterium ADurb.Bin429]|nr:MAG: hypothetical protein BWY76_01314 [bacterium ADurb.Bin429]